MATVHRALPVKTADELAQLRLEDIKEILRSAGCGLGGKRRKADIIDYYLEEQGRFSESLPQASSADPPSALDHRALSESRDFPPVPPREKRGPGFSLKTRAFDAAATTSTSTTEKALPGTESDVASKMKTTECPVCLENVEPSDNCDLECRHAIHVVCARKLRDARCPMCRGDISSATSKIAAGDVAEMRRRKIEDAATRDDRILRDARRYGSPFESGVRSGLIVRRVDSSRIRNAQPRPAVRQVRSAENPEEEPEQVETGGVGGLSANDPRSSILRFWEALGAGLRNSLQQAENSALYIDPAEGTPEYAEAVNETVEAFLGMPASGRSASGGIQQIGNALQAAHPFYSPEFLHRLQSQVRQIIT